MRALYIRGQRFNVQRRPKSGAKAAANSWRM
jgi:hypothetical protein